MSVGLLLGLMVAGAALAQQTPPPASAPASSPAPRERGVPPPDELEPAVDTAKSTDGASAATPASPAPAAPAADAPAAPGGGAASNVQGTSESTSGSGKPRGRGGAAAARATPAGSKASARKGPDRLELDTTDITGNRELPKVLYIVPWKRSDLGDLTGKPVNSLLDEVLQPLDRDVFTRENRYYDTLKPGQAAGRQGAVQDSGGKP
jgi:hypothetical protein